MTEKNNWREEVERQIETAKSPSQKYRFALLHVWKIEQQKNPTKANFEDYYKNTISTLIESTLDSVKND